MKKIFNIVSIISAALLVFACAPKESYKPGAPDDPNCMGVFFPAQELKSAFAPEETFQVDVKVSRAKASGDVIVPAKVYGNEDDYFFVSPIEFLDGQTETTCTIFFSKDMPLGKEYKLTVAIEDPAYASKYNKNASFINVPVVIENYKYLGEADFSDEFEFTLTDGTVPTFKVPLYQNVMDPNEFRLIEPYKEGNAMAGWTSSAPAVAKLNFKIVQPGFIVNKGTKYEFTIKGEDLVYFEDYYTGDSSTAGGAPCDIMAYSPFYNKEFVIGQSEADCADCKVVNYQDPDAEGNVLPSVVQLMPTYLLAHDGRGWGPYPVIIIFPGGKLVDYSFGISTAECKDGQSPITFSLGKDVTAVKYLVYPGELSAKEIRQETALIAAGEKAAKSLDVTLPRIFVTCEETGLYTIIAVAFDKNGVQQASASTVFGYVKPGDEEDVAIVFDANVEPTPARYEKDGYSTMNSLLFYMVGDDVTSVRYGLYKTEAYEKDAEAIKKNVETSGTLLGDTILEKINKPGGYVDLFTKLSPLTSYTLVVYAFNGYTGKTVVRTLSTEGLPKEKVGKGVYSYDILSGVYQLPITVTREKDLLFDPNTTNEYSIPVYDFLDLFGVPNDDSSLDFVKNDEKKITVKESYAGDGLYVQEFEDWVEDIAIANGVPAAVVYSAFGLEAMIGEHSFYDKETDTYNFCVMFFDDQYFYDCGYETFAMSAETEIANSSNRVKLGAAKNLAEGKSFGDFKFKRNFRIANIKAEREIKAANVEVKSGKAENSGSPRKAQPRKLFSK